MGARNRNTASEEGTVKRLFTKERLLFFALALLLLLVLLGTGFLLIPRPTTTWTFQTEYIDTISSPIVSHGLVYSIFRFSLLDNNVYALDAHSGQIRWSSHINGFIDTTPIVANGLLYVLVIDDRETTLHALDVASGREQWSYQQTDLSPLTIVDDIVYAHSSNGIFYALDALSGRLLWSMPVGDISFAASIVANHLVYFAARDSAKAASTVFALDAASGHLQWSVVEPTPLIGQLAVAGGVVYLAENTPDMQVWALDAFSGKALWSAQPTGPNLTTALSLQVVNGMAYVDYGRFSLMSGRFGPNVLFALDARTGRQVWTAQTISSEPMIANGLVYVYSGNVISSDGALICAYDPCPTSDANAANGILSALDAHSGRQQWSHPAVPFEDQSFIAPEPAVTSGTLYVWTTKNHQDTLYALNAVSGSEQWSYQTRGSFSTSPTVMQGIVYTCLSEGRGESMRVIKPPGGPPGFSW